MKKIWFLLPIALLLLVAAPHFAAAAYYPFGGRILFIFPPLLSPCGVQAILVGPPSPGTFIIPPVSLYANFNYLTIGNLVLGVAASPACGIIYAIGTS